MAGDSLQIDLGRPTHLAAVFCMLAGIAALGAGLWAHGRAMDVTGPTALGVADNGNVLIVLDHALHRADDEGRWQDSRSFAELNLVGPVSDVAAAGDAWLVADNGRGEVLRCDQTACRSFLKNASGTISLFAGRTRLLAVDDGWWVVDEAGSCLVRRFDGDGIEQASLQPARCRAIRDLQGDGDALLLADGRQISRVIPESKRTQALLEPVAGDRTFPVALALQERHALVLVADAMLRDARALLVSLPPAGHASVPWQDAPRRIDLPGENELTDVMPLGQGFLLSETNGMGLWMLGVDGRAVAFGDGKLRAALAATRDAEASWLGRYRLAMALMLLLFAAAVGLAGHEALRSRGERPATSSAADVRWLARIPPEAVVIRVARAWLTVILLGMAVLFLPALYVALRLPELLNVVTVLELPLLAIALVGVGIFWVRQDRQLRALPNLGWRDGRLVLGRLSGEELAVLDNASRRGEYLGNHTHRTPWRRHGVLLFSEADLDRLLDSGWRAWHETHLREAARERWQIAAMLAALLIMLTVGLALNGEPAARQILAN